MNLTNTHRSLTELLPASVAQLQAEDISKPRANEAPAAHVPVLLLGPNETGRILVFLEFLLYFSCGEGTERLQSDDGRLLNVVFLSVFGQGVVMFARDKNQSGHSIGIGTLVIADDRFEMGA